MLLRERREGAKWVCGEYLSFRLYQIPPQPKERFSFEVSQVGLSERKDSWKDVQRNLTWYLRNGNCAVLNNQYNYLPFFLSQCSLQAFARVELVDRWSCPRFLKQIHGDTRLKGQEKLYSIPRVIYTVCAATLSAQSQLVIAHFSFNISCPPWKPEAPHLELNTL